MPSRITIVGIVLFWLGTAAAVAYRDVWPRFFSDEPPTVSIDLADEATQAAPTKWKIYRGNDQVGTLSTRTEYLEADDTFRYVNNYRNLIYTDGKSTKVVVPRIDTSVRVARDGSLREQTMNGVFEVTLNGAKVASATASVDARVVNGELVGQCKLTDSPFGNIDRPLEPVPVTSGQVLNPLMPVNRLRGVSPGRRWTIQRSDPVEDSLKLLFKEAAGKSTMIAGLVPKDSDRELLAEVLSSPETITRKNGEQVVCWVIEYRGQDTQARTWVSRADGRVMRQEAARHGDVMRFERDD